MSAERDAKLAALLLARDRRGAERAEPGDPRKAAGAALEREADALASALAELAAVPAVAPPPSLRVRVLAAADPATAFDGFAARVAELFDWPDERALTLLRTGSSPEGDAWLEGPDAGIRVRPLAPGPRHGLSVAGLVWCEPGAVFPRHRHHGHEWALVLSGRARNSGGEHWSVGDVVHQPPGSVHSFTIPRSAPPLLAAVVVRQGFALVGERCD